MKSILVLCFLCSLIAVNTNEVTMSYELEIQAIITKDCESLSLLNKIKCENLIREKYKSKTKYRVEAVLYSNENNQTEGTPKSDLFNFAMPINTCKNEDCEFCCLSTNRCGTKKQCSNSKYYIRFVNWIFISLIIILVISLIIKCYQVDSLPDQMNSEKIDNSDLNELISMFGIIRNNRKKLIS